LSICVAMVDAADDAHTVTVVSGPGSRTVRPQSDSAM